MMPTIHSFPVSLEYAKSKEHLLDKQFQEYFQTKGEIIYIETLNRQRAGVDIEITFESGEKVIVQVKWRDRPFSNDFLIEFCSVFKNEECKSPGWIYTMDAAFIFVVYEKNGIDHIIQYPVPPLKLAWKNNKDEWMRKYRIRKATITIMAVVLITS
jgi:hypothetical protein